MKEKADGELTIERADLPEVGLLSELEPEIRRRLVAKGKFEVLDPETYLVKQGNLDDNLSVVVKGTLKISCHANGDYLELAHLGPGHTVGEMAVLDPQKCSADVKVVGEQAWLWTIPGDAFRQFLESDHNDGYAILSLLTKELCRRLRTNSEHMLTRAEELRTHFLDIDY